MPWGRRLAVDAAMQTPAMESDAMHRTSADGMRMPQGEEAQPIASTSSSWSPMHDMTPIMERRRALAQVAFVRHSTSELQQQLRSGSDQPWNVRSSGLASEGLRLPGSLYNHDRQDKTPIKVHSTGALPLISSSVTLAAISSSLAPVPSYQESAAVLEANLNGIGHPVVLRNHRSTSGAQPNSDLLTPAPNGAHIMQLLHNTPPSHFYSTQRSTKLPALHLMPRSAPADHRTPASSDAGDGDRRHMRRLDTLPGPHRGGPPQPVVAIAKPLGQDTLNLWRGKRLTRLEMKVEQKLHVVRNNPVAATDLQHRVHSYIEEKAQEQAERMALAELAAERREQKTLEFVGNRLKGGKQGGGGGGGGGAADLTTSLFDRVTGKPRNDSNPLPDASTPFWTGFLALAQKLGQLREQLQLRAADKRENDRRLTASLTIQRHWRGFRDRKVVRSMRVGPVIEHAAAGPGVGPVTQAMADEAAAKVWAFIEYSHNSAILGYLRKRFREKNSSDALGSVANAFLSAENIRSFRIQIKIAQWMAIEARCIELAKKRMRSQIIGELDVPETRVAPAVSGSGLKPLLAAERETTIKAAVAEALSRTFPTDRVILEDLRPVPKPVKMATLQVFIAERLQAYVAQIGMYWKKRARYIAQSRAAQLRAKAIHVLTESYGPPPTEPVSPSRRAQMSESGMSNPDDREAAVELAAHLTAQEADHGDGSMDPGPFPRYRSLMTIPEMKAIMQQGVAETPFFKSYLMRQKLQAYENELTQELTHRYAEQDEAMQKEIARRAKTSKVKSGTKISDSLTRSPEKPKDVQRTKSFTLALLLHRWHTECNPRIQACLHRRYELANMTLLGCLSHGKWLPHEDMGSKLMELREG